MEHFHLTLDARVKSLLMLVEYLSMNFDGLHIFHSNQANIYSQIHIFSEFSYEEELFLLLITIKITSRGGLDH